MIEYLNINDLIINMNRNKDFLCNYLYEVNKIGYTKNETLYIKLQIEIIDEIIKQLSYKSLCDLLIKSSNRRLKKIISGEEYLANILECPEDYNLVIDLENLNNVDVRRALIFIDLRQKYCYFQHKNLCNIGLNYINGKWQLLK
ncbi:hypothetical protein [Anaerovorax odorimutans]|uniref:hypothetical protein n=1 Tax=Anaerovorax odorimutans TaxID=109327 RepID=UPI0004896020|nr:hypothetical protein [Anaerovorax odorimutans]